MNNGMHTISVKGIVHYCYYQTHHMDNSRGGSKEQISIKPDMRERGRQRRALETLLDALAEVGG